MEPFQSSFYRESLPPSAQTSLGEPALPARKSHADGPTTRARGRWRMRLFFSLSAPQNSKRERTEWMADKRVWFITGAGRGMGVDIAKAALAAGHFVVATGRSTDAVAKAVGEADDLLVVELDITSPESAEEAVRAALDRFARIDVLVNNAGN